MKSIPKWAKALTAGERMHLREMNELCTGKKGPPSLSVFKQWAAHQKKRWDAGKIEPCWECKFIAQKLGLEV